MSIILDDRQPATAPVLIAGWPGMGQVGVGASEYLRRKLGGEHHARIDVSAYVVPDAITVEAGMGRMPDPPKQDIYYVAEPRLFIFEGDTQLSGEAGLQAWQASCSTSPSRTACERYTPAPPSRCR